MPSGDVPWSSGARLPGSTLPSMDKLVSWDRTFGLVSLGMWGGTAIKVAPYISPINNAQSWVGLAAIFLLAVAWPTWARDSYCRWRTPIVAFLRLFLFVLPFNLSTEVFDAIAPQAHTGRFAVVANVFQLVMCIRIALLNFTSMGWRLPFRLHIILQVIIISAMMKLAVHPWCAGKFLRTREISAVVDGFHSSLASLAMPLVPAAAVLVPEGAYAKRVAALLFSWIILGFLMPTLLLLPEGAGLNGAAQQWSDAAAWSRPHRRGVHAAAAAKLDAVGSSIETLLRCMLPADPDAQLGGEYGERAAWPHLPAGLILLLRWWLVLLIVWGACCTAAPLFGEPTVDGLEGGTAVA